MTEQIRASPDTLTYAKIRVQEKTDKIEDERIKMTREKSRSQFS